MRSDFDTKREQASRVLKVDLSRHTTSKAVGPCPRCGGNDRFVVWLFEGTGWCSHCGHSVIWDSEVTQEEILQTRVKKQEEARSARIAMSRCEDWKVYHREVTLEQWVEQGIGREDIDRWQLGSCTSCPLLPEYASLTIPIFHRGKLVDIRHRLVGDLPPEVGRYRSHMAGLVPHPFNLDATHLHRDILVVDGEKKAIHLARAGYLGTVGLPGDNMHEDLLISIARSENAPSSAVVVLDPGAYNRGCRLAEGLKRCGVASVRVADPFMKPDDLLVKYGELALREVIEQAQVWR